MINVKKRPPKPGPDYEWVQISPSFGLDGNGDPIPPKYAWRKKHKDLR